MCNERSVRFSSDATVKSHARYRPLRSTPATSSVVDRLVHRPAALFDLRDERRDHVPVDLERTAGRDDAAVRALQPAQPDDDAVSRREVARGPDDERARRVTRRVGVQLGEERPPFTGGRVEQHDRLIRVERTRDVGDRRGTGLGEVDAGDEQEDRGSRREPVVAVVLRRVDRGRGTRRRGPRRSTEVDPAAGVR